MLCPVVAGAKIIKRVRSIPGQYDESKTCTFLTAYGKITYINSAQVLLRFRATVGLIGMTKLGLSKEDVGLY